MVSDKLANSSENIDVNIELLQKAAVLRTARILRRTLDAQGCRTDTVSLLSIDVVPEVILTVI